MLVYKSMFIILGNITFLNIGASFIRPLLKKSGNKLCRDLHVSIILEILRAQILKCDLYVTMQVLQLHLSLETNIS